MAAATVGSAGDSAAAAAAGSDSTQSQQLQQRLRMRVKADVTNFGALAGGVLAHVRSSGHPVELDAVGESAISNAVKAVALANEFAGQEGSASMAFEPRMVVDEAGRKLLRLSVQARPRQAEAPPTDFSAGGIYVPVDAKSAGQRAGGGVAGAKDVGAAATASLAWGTPAGLARTAMGEWMRFAAPELRAAGRAAAMQRAMGTGPGVASFSADEAPRRDKAPFLLTMGPPALARAAKALAFVCGDLQKDHVIGVPMLVVVPRFWARKSVEKRTGQEKTTQTVVLWLTHAEIAAW